MQSEVRKLMSGQLRPPTSGSSLYTTRSLPPQRPRMPPLVASCSAFGRTVCCCSNLLAADPTIVADLHARLYRHRHLPMFLSAGNGHGRSGSRSEHGASVQLPEAPSGCTGAVPRRFPLCCTMKFAHAISVDHDCRVSFTD
jgi:hypothetical protein